MKNPLTFSLITLTAITMGVVLWYAQKAQENTAQNIQENTVQRDLTTKSSETPNTTKQLPKEEVEPQNGRSTDSTDTNSVDADNTQTNNTAIRYNADGSIDTSNWREYQPIGNIDVIFPPNWYYKYEDSYGFGFVSNKDHSKDLSISKFGDDEVRMRVVSIPADIEDASDLDKALKEVMQDEKNNLEWSCLNIDKRGESVCSQYKIACSSSDISGSIGRKYGVVQCLYMENEDNLENSKHILEKIIVFQNKSSIILANMTVASYDKDLINKEIFDVIFKDMTRKILMKY